MVRSGPSYEDTKTSVDSSKGNIAILKVCHPTIRPSTSAHVRYQSVLAEITDDTNQARCVARETLRSCG